MNYYPFHLGDYAAHTGHLDPLEDLAYRRMLDAYYLRESPLPSDPTEIARLIRLRDQAATVRDVLNEFFVLTDYGWRHTRCDQEIDRMQDKQAKARSSAAASVNARRTKAQPPLNDGLANAERTLNERSTDVELPTPTPTPKEKKTRSASAAHVFEKPGDVDQKVWDDFQAIRKAKRAPLTSTALNQLRSQASKAGITLQAALETCCARGWQGFNADWLARDNLPATATRQGAAATQMSFRERDEAAGRKRWEEMTGRKWPTEQQGVVIDAIASPLELSNDTTD